LDIFFEDPNLQLTRKLAGLEPDAVLCSKLSWASGTCNVCECPNTKHIREKTTLEPRTRMVVDENVKKVLDDTKSDMEKSQSILKILEDTMNAMQAENNVIVEAGARFAVFLLRAKFHCHLPQCDPGSP
jgi:hypothetical protein